ncbi:MAG: tRNA dihydrouridine synthase, partial [Gemmatirosa sp.]
RATHLPVTVKTRSGWSEDTRDPVGIALRMQDAGAKAFTLHARTRTQMYTGHARWEEIAAVVEALEVPVIGNGDIKTPEDALRMHRVTNAAGIMIGRGSYGQPWIFDQTKDLLAGRPMRATPDVETRFAVALDHARMVQEYEADPIGAAIEFRKHLGWYAKGLPNSADLRRKLHTVSSFGEVEGIFADYVERMRRGEFAQPSTGAATADGGEELGVEEPCCEDAVA